MAKINDANIPYLTFTEQGAAPSTPATGKQLIYPKSDGKWYTKDDAGIETELGAGGGGGSVDMEAYTFLEVRKGRWI